MGSRVIVMGFCKVIFKEITVSEALFLILEKNGELGNRAFTMNRNHIDSMINFFK